MENHEELWLQYLKQHTENARDCISRTGLVFGVGFGPGAAMVSSPMFGMMMASTMTGVYDCRTLVEPAPDKPVPKYSNAMLNLWDLALNQEQK